MMQNGKNLKYNRNYTADFVNLLVSLSLFVAAVCLAFFFSPMISEDVKAGLLLCYTAIIPSVFPFMILADLMLSYMHFENFKALRYLFSRLFKINGYAISAFVAGIICGFPIGAKMAKELYVAGKITKNECERLIGFSNNASPAFVISGVGYGLLGSLKTGVFLYTVSVISSVIVGISAGLFQKLPKDTLVKTDLPFSFTKSIKSASQGTLTVCGFITFFSIVIGFLGRLIKSRELLVILSSFLEIGNATRLIAQTHVFSNELSLSLFAFTIGFSGLSVHFQSRSLIGDTDISMKKYYIMKLLTGALSSIITALFFLFT
ncbi:MAG: hypothetical protein IJW38_03865 [Clostridia bacterium]|nr:hypothetical protein [Clostridia bacterium]